MGRKKAKERSPRGDTTLDLSGATCTHIRKAIDHSLLKKAGVDKHWNSCQVCEQEKNSTGDGPVENEAHSEAPAVWMCLKCGHRGCGRSSENQHAIKHYETPRSEPHCLVLSLDNWSVWCYTCDDDVHFSRTGQLAQLVSNIRKQTQSDSGQKTLEKKVMEENSIAEDDPEEKEEKKEKGRKSEKQNAVVKVRTVASTTSTGAVPVRGLSNMGNTCFFNAVLQNLSQTRLLRDLLRNMKDEETRLLLTPPSSSQLDPLDVQLRSPGSLTLTMCQLLHEIENTQKSVVTPKELFTQVCKKAPRFKGYQQQDSHELLRILLDGIKTEESARFSAGILEALKHSENNSKVELLKDYEKSCAARTVVDSVFGGELTNTLMCKECGTVSLVKEPFLDLCLPVAEEAYRKKNMKKGVQQRRNSSGATENTVPAVSGNDDMPTGAGSKYQQKKAKKQARKQVKNQRRQQKLESKFTLESLTNEITESPDALPNTSTGTEDGGEQPTKQSEAVVSVDQDCEKLTKEDEEEEEEEEKEDADAADRASTLDSSNRFNALLEEVTGATDASTEREEGEEVEAEDKEEDVRDTLADSISALTLHPDTEAGPKRSCVEYTVVTQDPDTAFRSLASRTVPDKQECSVESCFHHYTDVELMNESNCLLCVTCTNQQPASSKVPDGSKKNIYRETLKQTLITSTPPVLSLQMKRFQQVGYSMTKVTRHVQFPQVLDIAPYCSHNCKGVKDGETKVLYCLYGVVEHSGTMRSGHYQAYVKSRPQTDANLLNESATPGEAAPPKSSWFQISDSSVKPVREAEVHNSQAYLLFYERIY